METTSGKRKRKTPHKAKVTRKFRAPRKSSQGVIPGLLMQTNIEKKVLWTNFQMVLNSTGEVQCLNLIRVGSSMFNRIGRKIEMRSLRIKTILTTLNVTRATVTPSFCRLCVIYDRQTNGALPPLADIFQDTSQAGTNNDNALSGINMDNRERFVTLIQKNFPVPQATATAGVLTNVFPNASSIPIVMDEFRQLRGLTTHYRADSAPAVIGDISTGSLLVTTDASPTAAGAELFQIEVSARLKYVDV